MLDYELLRRTRIDFMVSKGIHNGQKDVEINHYLVTLESSSRSRQINSASVEVGAEH